MRLSIFVELDIICYIFVALHPGVALGAHSCYYHSISFLMLLASSSLLRTSCIHLYIINTLRAPTCSQAVIVSIAIVSRLCFSTLGITPFSFILCHLIDIFAVAVSPQIHLAKKKKKIVCITPFPYVLVRLFSHRLLLVQPQISPPYLLYPDLAKDYKLYISRTVI